MELNRELRVEIDERRHAEQAIRASRQELASILDNMQDMYFRTDLNGVVQQVSPSVRELLGYAPHEVVGLNVAQIFNEGDDLASFMRMLERTNGSLWGYEVQIKRKDGQVIWVSKNAQYYRDENGDIAGVEGTSHEITKLKTIQAELNAEKERALVTLASIADGVIATDADGRVDYINPVAEIMTGWTAMAALGRPLTEIFHVIDEDTRQLADDPVRACLRTRRQYRIPGHPILLPAGSAVEYSVEISVAPIFDESAQVAGTSLVMHDVTELRGLAREMSYQASHDLLTGLVNRREFEIRAESAVQTSRREGVEHALCYLDLDQFKVVNDTCGHIAGDNLIRQIATLLRGRLRESDTLARLGGDEFGVLLEGCPLTKAHELANELRNLIHDSRFEWEGHRFEISVSIGVVAITAESGGLAEVLTFADSACYVAKDQGRNRVHVFDPEDSALVEHHSHMRWVQRLQLALEEGRFELHYQRADALIDVRHLVALLRNSPAHARRPRRTYRAERVHSGRGTLSPDAGGRPLGCTSRLVCAGTPHAMGPTRCLCHQPVGTIAGRRGLPGICASRDRCGRHRTAASVFRDYRDGGGCQLAQCAAFHSHPAPPRLPILAG